MFSHDDKLGLSGSCKCFLFFFFLPGLVITTSQAAADTVRTEILPCVQDHVQDRPTAVDPGEGSRHFPSFSSHRQQDVI